MVGSQRVSTTILTATQSRPTQVRHAEREPHLPHADPAIDKPGDGFALPPAGQRQVAVRAWRGVA